MDAGFARVDARFAAQDKKVTELFAAQDKKVTELFAAQDKKVTELFAAQDKKVTELFAAQDDKIDMTDLKLTALIASLNKTNEVGAALDGRLLNSDASTAALGGQPANRWTRLHHQLLAGGGTVSTGSPLRAAKTLATTWTDTSRWAAPVLAPRWGV